LELDSCVLVWVEGGFEVAGSLIRAETGIVEVDWVRNALHLLQVVMAREGSALREFPARKDCSASELVHSGFLTR
jgi:hypothetical protein